MTKWFGDGTNKLPGQDPATPEPGYADTEPMALPELKTEPDFGGLSGLSLAPVETSLYEVMAAIRKDNRVCPQPTRWLEFYRILQERGAGAPLPASPLTGSAWAATPPSAKRTCFRDQVEWAANHDCLRPAWDFLSALPDTDWYCAD
jgi:hypothetical protein